MAAPRAAIAMPVRSMHRSAPLWNAVVRDRDQETGLYYHDLGKGEWAVSLLEKAPKGPSSLSVIGKIAPQNTSPDEFVRTKPDEIKMNPAFWDALHQVLKEQIPDDIQLQFEADMRGDGWAHLCGTYPFSHRRTPLCDAGPHLASRGHLWQRGLHRVEARAGHVRAQRDVPLCCEARRAHEAA